MYNRPSKVFQSQVAHPTGTSTLAALAPCRLPTSLPRASSGHLCCLHLNTTAHWPQVAHANWVWLVHIGTLFIPLLKSKRRATGYIIIHIVSIRCLYVTATFLSPAFTKLMASPCKTWARSSGMARVGMSLGAGRSWISSLPKVQKLAEHAWQLGDCFSRQLQATSLHRNVSCRRGKK